MTTIEWTHPPDFRGESWNPITGCTKVSQGCKHCYAERVFPRAYAATGRKFVDVQTHPERLDAPLRRRAPTCWFVNSMSDLFHEGVDDEFIDRVFAVMALCQQHRFIVLTKRPQRMLKYLGHGPGRSNGVANAAEESNDCIESRISEIVGRGNGPSRHPLLPLPNVWLGVSCEDQATAEERIPLLLQTPAAVRLVSLEPLLGPIRLTDICVVKEPRYEEHFSALPDPDDEPGAAYLDWLIVGGESGPGARPCNVEWIREIVRQGRDAGVACFVKQAGAHVIDRNDGGYCGDGPSEWPEDTQTGDSERWQGAPTRVLLRDRKGGDPSEWPTDLRVRESPQEPQP